MKHISELKRALCTALIVIIAMQLLTTIITPYVPSYSACCYS